MGWGRLGNTHRDTEREASRQTLPALSRRVSPLGTLLVWCFFSWIMQSVLDTGRTLWLELRKPENPFTENLGRIFHLLRVRNYALSVYEFGSFLTCISIQNSTKTTCIPIKTTV